MQMGTVAGIPSGHGLESREASLTLRLADSSDGASLRRLAQLDSRSLPPGPHLIAEREGRIDAALSLRGGELVADPFRRTAEICELLRHHAVTMAGVRTTSGVSPVRARPVTLTA